MNPALAVLGVALLLLFLNLILRGVREGMEPQDEGELEQTIDENIRVWADSQKEAQRIDRMFRIP